MICAVAQNELVFMEWDPLGGAVNGLKLANTILTVSSLIWIYRSHHLKVGDFSLMRKGPRKSCKERYVGD